MKVDIEKFLSIPYCHNGRDYGGADCYGLVCLFYRDILDVELPDFEYEKDWAKQGLDHIRENYQQAFEKIESPVRFGLVTFHDIGSRVDCHMGVMLDEISFLHIRENQLAHVCKLTDPVWKRQVSGFYRLKKGLNGSAHNI